MHVRFSFHLQEYTVSASFLPHPLPYTLPLIRPVFQDPLVCLSSTVPSCDEEVTSSMFPPKYYCANPTQTLELSFHSTVIFLAKLTEILLEQKENASGSSMIFGTHQCLSMTFKSLLLTMPFNEVPKAQQK